MVSKISWGVDGHGRRHYICDYCELYFGVVDRYKINHKCDKSKPAHHNRGKNEHQAIHFKQQNKSN